jgi:hypothetical protein
MISNRLIRWLPTLFFILSTPVSAQQPAKSIRPIGIRRRVTVVIGNSNYLYAPQIPPASNDA